MDKYPAHEIQKVSNKNSIRRAIVSPFKSNQNIPLQIQHTSLLKKLKMSRIKKKKGSKIFSKWKNRSHDSRRVTPFLEDERHFTDCYLGAGAHPNMLKEWKRWRAGNMPILLDAFYCRDKRLSCLPLTSPLTPPSLPPAPLFPRDEGK